MRLLGAGLPAWPSADEGMIVGAATAANAPVFRKRRRLVWCDLVMSKSVGCYLPVISLFIASSLAVISGFSSARATIDAKAEKDRPIRDCLSNDETGRLILDRLGSLVLQEALASDDGLDEISEALVGAGHFLADPVDARAIAAVQFAADGIGEQFPGETAGEGFVLRDNQLPELGI